MASRHPTSSDSALPCNSFGLPHLRFSVKGQEQRNTEGVRSVEDASVRLIETRVAARRGLGGEEITD